MYMCKALCGAPGKVSPNKRNYKQDIIKARKGSHGFTETRQKDHGIKIVEGGRMEHTLLDGGHMQVAKVDPEAQMKSSLSDCIWLE